MADARSATFTDQPGTGQLRRCGDDRMLAGVALAGLARYLGAGVTLVRVIIAALAVFTGAWRGPVPGRLAAHPRRRRRGVDRRGVDRPPPAPLPLDT